MDVVKAAPQGTPCQHARYGSCESGMDAVHVLLTDLPAGDAGTALCAYHSPYGSAAPEVINARREYGAKLKAARTAQRRAEDRSDMIKFLVILGLTVTFAVSVGWTIKGLVMWLHVPGAVTVPLGIAVLAYWLVGIARGKSSS